MSDPLPHPPPPFSLAEYISDLTSLPCSSCVIRVSFVESGQVEEARLVLTFSQILAHFQIDLRLLSAINTSAPFYLQTDPCIRLTKQPVFPTPLVDAFSPRDCLTDSNMPTAPSPHLLPTRPCLACCSHLIGRLSLSIFLYCASLPDVLPLRFVGSLSPPSHSRHVGC